MEDITPSEVPGTEYVRASALTVLSSAMDPDGMMNDGADGATTGPLTSVAQIRDLRRTRQIYGREIALRDVDVDGLAGDSTFFIVDPDASGGARMLVVLEDLGEGEADPTGRQGSDGRYNVDTDDNINVFGRIARFSGTERYVSGANRSRLLPDSLYIRATRVTAADNGTSVRIDR